MKKTITRELLKQWVRTENRSSLSVIVMPAIFALVCVVLIPVRAIGFGVAAVVLCLVLLYLRKLRSLEPVGKPEKAYLRRLELTAKEESKTADPDSAGNAYSTRLLLCFGADSVEVDSAEFERAEPGEPYYVAFFSENGRAFACFSCREYEPAAGMEVR